MERADDLPAASTRKFSDTKAGPSDSSIQPQANKIHPYAESWLEDRAIEMYCDVLLSRAHFLLFNSLRARKGGVGEEEDEEALNASKEKEAKLLYQGSSILGKAESICMVDGGSVRDRLLAKYHYVKGFLHDIDGDKENAHECFQQATDLDGMYRGFERVEFYLGRERNSDELDELWSNTSPPSESGNKAHHFGGPDSAQKAAWRASVDSQGTQDSELFRTLMGDIQETPQSPDSNGKVALPTTPPTVHHSLPFPTEVDRVFNQVMGAPSKASIRRPSEDILNTLKEYVTPENDESYLLAVKTQAEREAAEREKCAREAQQDETVQRWRAQKRIGSPKRTRLPTAQETRLLDTPSVDELDAPNFSPPNRSLTSPTSPITVTTQGIRKLSGSSAPGKACPSSPLREYSLPGGRDNDESPGS